MALALARARGQGGNTLNSLHPCPLPQRAPFAAVRRVLPLCAAFRAGCEVCARHNRKSQRCADVRATQENTGAIRQSNAENPRYGGENPPVREEPASHLASRRRTGSLPNASNRAEAHTHFNGNGGKMKKDRQFSIRISAQDLETIRQKRFRRT